MTRILGSWILDCWVCGFRYVVVVVVVIVVGVIFYFILFYFFTGVFGSVHGFFDV